MKHHVHASIALATSFALAACGSPQHQIEPSPAPAPAPAHIEAETHAAVRHAELRNNRIEIDQTVDFQENSDALQDSAHPLLDEVAHVLSEHPEVTHLRIEGNTDNLGEADHNHTLSEQRAAAVAAYLHAHGVGAGVTLDTVGYGATRPLCPEATDDCRARNRRVDFIVVTGDAAAATPNAGTTTAAADTTAAAVGDADAGAPHHGGHHGHGH